jgi:hypothetical protein
LRHFNVLLASITLVATSASYVGDYRRRRSLSSVQQIHRGVGLISDSGRGSSPPRLTCRGDRGVIESCYWLHRNNAWHAGCSEQVSLFVKAHKRLKCAKKDLPIQWQHRDARTLGVPQCFFPRVYQTTRKLRPSFDAKRKLICYCERTTRNQPAFWNQAQSQNGVTG